MVSCKSILTLMTIGYGIVAAAPATEERSGVTLAKRATIPPPCQQLCNLITENPGCSKICLSQAGTSQFPPSAFPCASCLHKTFYDVAPCYACLYKFKE
ncbi:hypothetical protein INT43_005306 [Umbelopsis isabellina]|uniref:Uncharacterized protein n=1 Tax=Mortierella isabellina TaxID=91625 RepID=A0A8H7U7D9_MORIS|nr:hypothetical protein INT43_005306 [Umbelopsis isabellina]